jgi:hypothetical protein
MNRNVIKNDMGRPLIIDRAKKSVTNKIVHAVN